MEPLSVRNTRVGSHDRARGQLGALLALGVAVIALYCALVLGPYFSRMWQESNGSQMPSLVLSRTIDYLCVYLPLYVCLGFVYLFDRRAAPHAASLPVWRAVVFGALLGGGLFSLTLLAAAALGTVQENLPVAQDGLYLNLGLTALLTAFQVYGEEGFFRGWLQPVIATDWGTLPALVVTAALFAAAHTLTQSIGAIVVTNIFFAGLIFGLLAFRTCGVVAPFTAHWVWNWVEQSVVGLLPNPGIDPMGSVFDLDLTGPVQLSGGADGLNGSLILTVVFAMAIGAFLVYGKGSGQSGAIV